MKVDKLILLIAQVLEEEIEQLQKQISDLRTAETKTTSKAVALEAKKGSIPSWSCTLKQRYSITCLPC
ncbi:hypothetical protein AAMO2058_001399900 [Amorphochlora amoebiformis]